MSSNLKMYGYIIGVQIAALLSYMQLNIGKPKDEGYWIGAAIVIVTGLLAWGGRSPSNPLKRFQAPSKKEIAQAKAGARKADPNKVNE